MAMTKVEAAKLTQDMMLRGVIETIITESMILELLPFMEVTGTAVTYNREATLPAATFYDVGDTWTEATPTFTQVTAALKIMGGDADVDNFLQATYADPNDVEAEVIASRAKSVAYKFNEALHHRRLRRPIPRASTGCARRCRPAQQVSAGTNGGRADARSDGPGHRHGEAGATGRAADEQAQPAQALGPAPGLGQPAGGRPHRLRAAGALLRRASRSWSTRTSPTTRCRATSGAVCSSIYPIKFGQGVGVMGLEHGGIDIEEIGELETKDATRHRIKWYASMAIFSELGVARLLGINAHVGSAAAG